jgi:acyl-[acyl-carrier-protein]-phospholipid O-acyltransferase / long-chain-fatty-acid--[acyl-carrier-protein] ligase
MIGLKDRPARNLVDAACPGSRRGERLVLVTEQKGATRGAFETHARTKGASDLMVPNDVMIVDKLPLLGSGTPDLTAVARLVVDRQPAAAE